MTDILSLYMRDSAVMDLARDCPGAFQIGMVWGTAAATNIDMDFLPEERPLADEVYSRLYDQTPFLVVAGAFIAAKQYREFNAVQAGAEYGIVSTLTV